LAFERRRLISVYALGEHQVVALARQIQHLRDHLNRVLAVAVEGDDIFSPGVIQASGQRRLVPKITAQLYHLYTRVAVGQALQFISRGVGRAVVNVEDGKLVGQIGQRGAQTPMKGANHTNLVVNGRHNVHAGQFRLIHSFTRSLPEQIPK
jgi:hypothetical protein